MDISVAWNESLRYLLCTLSFEPLGTLEYPILLTFKGVRMLKTAEGESLMVKLIRIENTDITVIKEQYKNDTAPGLPAATSSKPNRVLVLPVLPPAEYKPRAG